VPDEVEEACVNKPCVRKSSEGRYLIYGVTDRKRYLFIVGINKGKGYLPDNNSKGHDRKRKVLA